MEFSRCARISAHRRGAVYVFGDGAGLSKLSSKASPVEVDVDLGEPVNPDDRSHQTGQAPPEYKSSGIPRKEVIQPQLPLRLPCYDFTPIIDPTFDGSLPKG